MVSMLFCARLAGEVLRFFAQCPEPAIGTGNARLTRWLLLDYLHCQALACLLRTRVGLVYGLVAAHTLCSRLYILPIFMVALAALAVDGLGAALVSFIPIA